MNNNPYSRWFASVPMEVYHYPNMNMYNSAAFYNGQIGHYWVQNIPSQHYLSSPLPNYQVVDYHYPNMYNSPMNDNSQQNLFYRAQNIQAQFLPNIPTPNIPTVPRGIPPVPTPNIPTVPRRIPPVSTPHIPTVPRRIPPVPTPNTPTVPRRIPPVSTPNIPTVPRGIPTIPTPTISTPRIDWRWREKVKQWGGHWVEEGESTWNEIVEGSKGVAEKLNLIRRRFQACVPPAGYSCIEYKVMENLPIFGTVETEDIMVRICHPAKFKFDVKEIKDTITKWLKDCVDVAVKDATKAFSAALIMTAWGAFVGSLSTAINAAINAFRESIFTCLTTPSKNIRINDQEIIPSVYMRKHSLFIPRGNNCFPMYDNWGPEIGTG